MKKTGIDVILLGHFSKDIIIEQGRERTWPGGAVYYSAFPLQRMGLGVAVVTKIADEDLPLLDELVGNGIGIYPCMVRETTSFKNIYKSPDNRIQEVTAVADPFSIDDLPVIEADFLHIGALTAGEVPAKVIMKAAEKYILSLDAQGFLRFRKGKKIEQKDWKEKKELLQYVNVLKVDSVEAEIIAGTDDMRKAAKKLSSYGPKEIVLTSSKGVLVYAGGSFYDAPFLQREMLGRTGRGDTCIASYIGRRINHSPEDSCRFAAALTSLKMEKPGPFRGSMEDVEKFLQRYY